MRSFDKKSVPVGTVLFPVPVVMVSCGEFQKKENIITIAWVGTVCSEPPMIAIGVRPERYSHDLIAQSQEFVVNIPDVDTVSAVQLCGVLSGKDTDKFSKAELTSERGQIVSSPLIRECPVNIECKVVETLNLGSHTLFVGEIVAVHADTDIVKESGGMDIAKAKSIAFASGEYWTLGQKIKLD